jgi:exoribonuclease R
VDKMSKQIVGTYASDEEAIKAIHVYELSGHQSSNIVILTNEEKAKALETRTKVKIKTNAPKKKEEQKGFFKKMFSKADDFELDTHEKLVGFGLADEVAEKCLEDVKLGKIVVIGDDELRMGHAATFH